MEAVDEVEWSGPVEVELEGGQDFSFKLDNVRRGDVVLLPVVDHADEVVEGWVQGLVEFSGQED